MSSRTKDNSSNSDAIDFYKQHLIKEPRSKLNLGCEVELLLKGILAKALKAEQSIKYKRVLDLRKKEG